MKAIANILVSTFFLISTIGVSVDKHYCLSVLRSTNLFSSFNEADCCGEIEKELDDCCNDESVYIRVEDDYNLPSFDFKLSNIVLLEHVKFNIFSILNISNKFQHVLRFETIPIPPLRTHLLNSVFLN